MKELKMNCQNSQSLANKFYSICLIGVTGHGKSSTANSLVGQKYFKASQNLQSETADVKGLVTHACGNINNEKLIVIDTPGFGDSKGRDTDHIAKMVINLKIIGYVHTFIITINS